MRRFESRVQKLKYKVLKEVAISTFNDSLSEDLMKIPAKISPGPKSEFRCCIYKERAIIGERIGLSVKKHSDNNPLIEVIDIACDECNLQRYMVTEACRGCLAHHCQDACPFDAIEIRNHKAYINMDKCKECGKCAKVCPYNAIAETRRPCITSCKANALTYSQETRKAVIEYDKCVNCGNCVSKCPFGAIMDRSQIVDVVKLLKQSYETENHPRIYAMIAPAISSQFNYATIEKVITGIKKLGFHSVLEVALGADIVISTEAEEVTEKLKTLDFMTTSCCPSFVDYIKKNHPDLEPHISSTVSPMIATARLIKASHPKAKIVFIGPCISKKAEASQYPEDIDYVLTFEELQALLDAKEIDVASCEPNVLDNASYYGRIFAMSGGIAKAAMHVDTTDTITPMVCNGLTEVVKTMKLAKAGRLSGNFIEGMACEGGCICGPASLSHGPKDKKAVDNYAKQSHEDSVASALRVLPVKDLHLHYK